MSLTQDRQGEDLGQGLSAGVCLSPHLCIADALGTDALGTNAWDCGIPAKNPTESHGCSVRTSPLPLVMLWGILAWEGTAPVVILTEAFIHVPPEHG